MGQALNLWRNRNGISNDAYAQLYLILMEFGYSCSPQVIAGKNASLDLAESTLFDESVFEPVVNGSQGEVAFGSVFSPLEDASNRGLPSNSMISPSVEASSCDYSVVPYESLDTGNELMFSDNMSNWSPYQNCQNNHNTAAGTLQSNISGSVQLVHQASQAKTSNRSACIRCWKRKIGILASIHSIGRSAKIACSAYPRVLVCANLAQRFQCPPMYAHDSASPTIRSFLSVKTQS